MRQGLIRFLFPLQLRNVPHRRLLLNVFRSLHILCFSVYLGGLYVNQSSSGLEYWFIGIIVSGLGLLMTDLFSSLIILFEVRGVSVLLKLFLLLLLPLMTVQQQIGFLMMLVIFSSFVSHSARRFRHRNLMPVTMQKKFGIEQRDHHR